MIEIKIQIRDRELLREYKGVHDDLLIEDFKESAAGFFNTDGTTITVCRKRKTKKKATGKVFRSGYEEGA
jgi:hypothetical protein